MERLAHLWQQRTHEEVITDYPIGPGDVLEISVPAMEELKNRTVRVSGDGTLSLPFIGQIQAAGLTREELRHQIHDRLEKYMYNPRTIIFVKEYHSRQVAVLGAVEKPGHYSLNSGTDTILDMISQAGGLLPVADPRIYLIPAEPLEKDKAKKVISTLPESFLSRDPSPLILKRTDPILIDVQELAYGGYQKYLSLPARPGDVLMVPGGGQVLVEGWVEKPGAYNVSPGLTVSGVVAAAGGPLYPADTSAVKIIRAERGGKKGLFFADLEKIKRGDQLDFRLQGGDIIEVSSSTGKVAAYGLYRFFSTVIGVAIGGNVPLF
ncbi:MAG: polysaccharide biosynthesis/export family protein [Deltaproteobacteria bacterium]|nr:polysaccharide biosynthesis/export family protein [Deltaproteobacteria bacterium]